jgi:hypothetical protein
MGHSGKVAEKHYLQVTDEHWSTAANLSLTASLVSSDPEPISKNHKTKKPSVLLGCDGSGFPENTYLVTPTGLEQADNSQGNRVGSGICPSQRPLSSSSTIPSELVELWPTLTDAQQAELMQMARAMACQVER